MTFIKIRAFIKNRIRKMKNYGIKITFRNFVYIKSKLKKMIVINDLENNRKEKNYSDRSPTFIQRTWTDKAFFQISNYSFHFMDYTFNVTSGYLSYVAFLLS